MNRPTPPPRSAIVEHWLAADRARFASLDVDPSEPSCFACGWRAPESAYSDDTPLARRWDSIGGYLERGHLEDHGFGGSNEPSNYVLLCPWCHGQMTQRTEGFAQGERDNALAWVDAQPRVGWVRQIITDALADARVIPKSPRSEDRIGSIVRRADRVELEAYRSVAAGGAS